MLYNSVVLSDARLLILLFDTIRFIFLLKTNRKIVLTFKNNNDHCCLPNKSEKYLISSVSGTGAAIKIRNEILVRSVKRV